MARLPGWLTATDKGYAADGQWHFTVRLSRWYWLYPGFWRVVLRRRSR